ncbi:hypothetical protein CC78DRAFT_205835 [Lojkania enalia]|uniref:F-box domain-containing protein n=1 Tax=Lojkania enalia TaxID=147567 RepID=A0A9P4JUY8_9PLEO|nr:hypothetical protein CC78DRAFT_205835 [Didymosphaeria enalia]
MDGTPSHRTNVNSLPNELLIQIATHLDTLPPSVQKFAHEPSIELTHQDETPLKSLSLVSWKWRKIVLPILFHYSRIPLDRHPQWVPIDARLLENMQSQLTNLSNHEMQIFHKMRSKFKSSSMFAFDESFDDLLINLCRVHDGDNFLKSVPNILWLPHLPNNFMAFVRLASRHNLKHHIKSIVLYSDKDYELRHVATADAPLARAVAEIWSQVFFAFDPYRVVVAAPPSTLAGLLDTQMLSSDTWAFNMKMHYIELHMSESRRNEMARFQRRPSDIALIHRRPWSHLGYNEGSSITAYSTYEYHLKQSPKMLYLILIRLAKEVVECFNIRSFSFHGVFPFSTNTTAIIRALHKIETLRSVQFQLAPGLENNLLSSPKRMGRAQPHDLWLEWNESYKVIAAYLSIFEFEDGSEFISKDCEDSTLASEFELYARMLSDKGAGWRKEGVGRWVRDFSLDREDRETLLRPSDVTTYVS